MLVNKMYACAVQNIYNRCLKSHDLVIYKHLYDHYLCRMGYSDEYFSALHKVRSIKHLVIVEVFAKTYIEITIKTVYISLKHYLKKKWKKNEQNKQ